MKGASARDMPEDVVRSVEIADKIEAAGGEFEGVPDKHCKQKAQTTHRQEASEIKKDQRKAQRREGQWQYPQEM